jgi:hypothetical protein
MARATLTLLALLAAAAAAATGAAPACVTRTPDPPLGIKALVLNGTAVEVCFSIPWAGLGQGFGRGSAAFDLKGQEGARVCRPAPRPSWPNPSFTAPRLRLEPSLALLTASRLAPSPPIPTPGAAARAAAAQLDRLLRGVYADGEGRVGRGGAAAGGARRRPGRRHDWPHAGQHIHLPSDHRQQGQRLQRARVDARRDAARALELNQRRPARAPVREGAARRRRRAVLAAAGRQPARPVLRPHREADKRHGRAPGAAQGPRRQHERRRAGDR